MHDCRHEVFIFEKVRRDRGVGLQSKRTVIPCGGQRRNQLTHAGGKRRRAAHDLMSPTFEVLRCVRLVGEQMPDLRKWRPAFLHDAIKSAYEPKESGLFSTPGRNMGSMGPQLSSPGESDPEALPEVYVSVSTCPSIRRFSIEVGEIPCDRLSTRADFGDLL